MTPLLVLAVLAYLFAGLVFAFIVRDGVGRTRIGCLLVFWCWPLLALFLFGLVAVEMISTGGRGYAEDEDERE